MSKVGSTTEPDDRSAAPPRETAWWVPGAAALAIAGAFVALLLLRVGGDASLLVHAGPPWTAAESAPSSLTVQAADRAFDGQFFYRLGVAPWSEDEVVAGVTNDLPSLRNARWGYGALAWAASGGNADLVPWSLIGVNLAAAFALGAAGGGLARSSGLDRRWGVLFLAWPGFAYSLSLDTSELVASAFVLGGLLAARHGRWAVVAAALAAAVITRDTTAVVPFGLAAAGAIGVIGRGASRPGPSAASSTGLLAAGGIPLAAFAGWQLLQRGRFGSLPLTSSGDNNLAAPLAGFFELLGDTASDLGGEGMFRVAFAVGVMATVALGAWAWSRTTAPVGEKLAWLAAVAVVLLLNAYLWSGATAFMRASTEAGILTIALVLAVPAARSRVLLVLALGLASGWLLTAAVQLAKVG